MEGLPDNEAERNAAMLSIVNGTYPPAHELIPGVWLGAQGVAGVGMSSQLNNNHASHTVLIIMITYIHLHMILRNMYSNTYSQYNNFCR